MPLQIRRGTTAQRLAITPLTGELVYDTTTGQLFVGNGTTLGGATTTGITTEDAQDAAAGLFTTGSHSGITFAYNDASGRIDATVTVAATGPFDGDLTGSVFSDASTLLVDGTSGRLVGPLATSGLVGDLDTGIFNIISSTGTVLITPSTGTSFGSNAELVDGNVSITRNTYSSAAGSGFNFAQHHETADSVNFTFYRTRGTGSVPTAVVNGDDIIDLAFIAHTGTASVAAGAISGIVDGVPTASQVPMKFQFLTNNGTSNAARAELSAAGIWKINNLGAFSGTTINVVDNDTITLGDVRLSQDGLSTINTNASLILSANGTGSVNIESVRIQGNAISVTDSTILNIESLQISGSTISTTDSSGITVSQATTFSSNLTVDGTLTVTDSIVQNNANNNYVTATLQTQGTARIVEGVHYGLYTQLVTNAAETFSTISYNSTIYKGCRATFKVHQSTNVYISEVLLVNDTTTVTIVNAQATAAAINFSIIGSITADYHSASGTIRLRPITSTSITSGLNLFWTVSYQLFT